jgi:type 2 lantibiotic biosynthesis protein LanM
MGEVCTCPGCATREEVQRFYERQGGYLALLYALEATDFHFENLIASGEHPVLVDLEALFHPHLEGNEAKEAEQLAGQVINNSVLRTGLLPQRVWAANPSEGIDISGLGGKEGQLTPFPVPHWEGMGNDEMRLTRKWAEMAGSQNRPTLNGGEVNPLDYTESITRGFASIYRLLLEHREELLAGNGPLAIFRKDEVRAILRSTQTYSALLNESFHPDVLRDALDRERLFDRLWVGVPHNPYLIKVIQAESSDLQRGDIPMLTTRPGSRDVWTASNDRIAEFFQEPGMALVQRRLRQLSKEDLARQLWFIRASLTSLISTVYRDEYSMVAHSHPRAVPVREQFLAAAREVGERLETLALRGSEGGDVAWVGLTPLEERHWSLAPLGLDLYDGLPGVALFLAYLGEVAQEERFSSLSRATLATVRRQVEHNHASLNAISAFSGWGGIIYVLTHLGQLWHEPDLVKEAGKTSPNRHSPDRAGQTV